METANEFSWAHALLYLLSFQRNYFPHHYNTVKKNRLCCVTQSPIQKSTDLDSVSSSSAKMWAAGIERT